MEKTVFVAASITSGRNYLPFVKTIIDYLQKCGYYVPSIHNGGDDPVETFASVVGDSVAQDPRNYRPFDNHWIGRCQFLIAEVSTPSHGVGGEIEFCRQKPALGLILTPILLVHFRGSLVSPYISALTDEETKHIWVREYSAKKELIATIDEFLAAF